MPKASPIKTSFNAGEWSPRLKGRVDLATYKNACDTLENYIPLVHGPIQRRPGTRFVAATKTPGKNVRLVSFQFNVEQAYVLEFGDFYIRFYKDGGQLLSGGSVYEISTPYSALLLDDLQFAQSADVMYIAHPDYAPRKLSRTGHTSWTITEVEFDWPPFDDLNTTTTTISTPSGVTGSVTINASSGIFDASMVGSHVKVTEVIESKYDQWTSGLAYTAGDKKYYNGNVYEAATSATSGSRPPVHVKGTESDGAVDWLYLHSGEGYAKITAYSSITSVTATVVERLPDSVVFPGTDDWALGAWSDSAGWPRAVAFYENRLWFAGSRSKPQTLWASTTADYENHQAGTNDDDGLNYTIASQEVNYIRWMVPGKVLSIGTSGREFTARGARSLEDAITPTNVRITPETNYGSNQIPPLKIGGVILFVQRSGKKIREYVYDFQSDSYVAANMNVMAEHLAETQFVDIAYQQEPDQIIWACDTEGKLYGFTYERAEEVTGWHRHPMTNGAVESLTVIPHWDGGRDSTWMVVERTIDGTAVKYIEYIEDYLTDEYATFSDCALTYDGSAATTISGLDHLEGEEVTLLVDGASHPNRTVSGGEITLEAPAEVVVVGLPQIAVFVDMPLEAGAADGTSQGKTMRLTNMKIRVHETGPGLWFGSDSTHMDELHTRESDHDMDAPIPLLTGDTKLIAWPGDNEVSPQPRIEHRLPYPSTIVALMPQVMTNDR